jgi:hypothetical protein
MKKLIDNWLDWLVICTLVLVSGGAAEASERGGPQVFTQKVVLFTPSVFNVDEWSMATISVPARPNETALVCFAKVAADVKVTCIYTSTTGEPVAFTTLVRRGHAT